MAYQKGFYGVGIAGEDTGSKGLVDALGSMNKSMQKYGNYVGTELDKEVQAAAEKAARVDTFKSYQDQVDKGEIDNTKSDFYVAHYDNVKGKTAGIEYQTKKKMDFETWFADQTNSDIDDIDGQAYMEWATEYDANYLDSIGDTSSYFHKGFDPYVSMAGQQLSSKYASANSTRLKEKGKLNLQLVVEDTIINNSGNLENVETIINALDVQSSAFRFVTRAEFNETVVQSYKNIIADIANKNNIDSDYDLALDLMEQIRNFKRPNGSRLLSGKDAEDWNKDIEKMQTEKREHDAKVTRMTQDASVAQFAETNLNGIKSIFFNAEQNDTDLMDGKEKYAALEVEWNSRWTKYLRNNNGLDPESKTRYARILQSDLKHKYQYADISEVDLYTRSSRFNIRGRFGAISDDYKNITYPDLTVINGIEVSGKALPDNSVINAEQITDPVILSLLRQSGRGKGQGKDYTFTLLELEQLYTEYQEWEQNN